MALETEFAARVRDCADRMALLGIDALGVLFDLTSPRLVRLAVAITRNQPDAEDAVQAALVRLAREPHLLAAAASPWAYLLQMVRNQSLAIARRKQRCSPAGDLADLITWCPVDEAEQEESHRSVWRAVRTLPPDQIEVVVLKIWEEMTFSQIGLVLEISPHTAASRYQYAMSKLARRLLPQHREVPHD